MGRRDRERRQSTARRRANQKGSGYSTTKFNLPDGLGFVDLKDDISRWDIVPYTVGKGNPFAKPGELHYERTYWQYSSIGAEQKPYVAPGKTFGARDFIQEWSQKEARNSDADEETLKALRPKERQLFLIWDHASKDKGIQLFDFSYHKFGKLLDARIDKSDEEEGWDGFYFPDGDGFTLKIQWEENKPYGLSAVAIDFVSRKEPLPDEIVNHGYCLDDFLIHIPYEKLEAIFLHQEYEEPTEEAAKEEEEPEPKKSSTPSQEKKSPSKDKPKDNWKTAESPWKKGDEVEYNGEKYTVMKISGDATSHTLLDANEEDIVKAVGADELKAWKDKEPEDEAPPFDDEDEDNEPAGVTADDDDDDNPWDDDF